jgi:hypothetical protein
MAAPNRSQSGKPSGSDAVTALPLVRTRIGERAADRTCVVSRKHVAKLPASRSDPLRIAQRFLAGIEADAHIQSRRDA